MFLSISGTLLVALLWWSSPVLLPFVLATLVAYVLTPLVAICERSKMPRSVAILLVYAVTLSSIYYSVAALAPRIYEEAVGLSREAPDGARKVARKWGPIVEKRVQGFLGQSTDAPSPSERQPAFEVIPHSDGSYAIELGSGVEFSREDAKHWVLRARGDTPRVFSVSLLLSDGIEHTIGYLKRNVVELLALGQLVVAKTSKAIFLFVMTLMVAAYLMHTRDDILGFLRSLPPPKSRPSFDRLVHRLDRGLSGVVRGQLLICAVNGVLSAIGFALFGLKYWPILALMAGVMSIIPIFGSILSTIPAVLVGLTQDFWTALWVLVWILMIHQVEANLLNPKIIGVAAKLHPVLVVFVLILGEHYFGLWGALFAVPMLSIAQSFFNHFRLESMPDIAPDTIALRSATAALQTPSPGKTSLKPG
ncbi:MAG: AI-2E family transporter [Polyangiaceae bacterium]|nr:AI-2E family transporter [Polyangiaceae bacterium]